MQILSSPVESHCSSIVSASSWLCSHSQDSGNAKLSSCSLSSLSSLQVPFLSVGGDIGVRAVRHCDSSPLSGDFVVEDVKGDGTCYFRRLIFLQNRNVVQSEARLLAPTPLPGTWGRGQG